MERRERAAKALKMRRAGYSPSEIAAAIPEYENSRQVRADLQRAYKEITAEPAAEILAVQFSRYERLIRAIWRESVAGDLPSMDRITKLIEGQSKLMRMGQGASGEDDHSDVAKFLTHLIGQFDESESEDLEDDEA